MQMLPWGVWRGVAVVIDLTRAVANNLDCATRRGYVAYNTAGTSFRERDAVRQQCRGMPAPPVSDEHADPSHVKVMKPKTTPG